MPTIATVRTTWLVVIVRQDRYYAVGRHTWGSPWPTAASTADLALARYLMRAL